MATCTPVVLDYPAARVPASSEWELVQRVCNSGVLTRSAKLRHFLFYICERALNGRTDEITEQQIGVYVFGRNNDYNPGEDSIVRSQARLLRRKLESYFEEEGRHETIRITIPKGTYIPVFEENQVVSGENVSTTDPFLIDPKPLLRSIPSVVEVQTLSSGWRRWWLFSCLLILLLFSGVSCFHLWKEYSYLRRPTHRFWASLFSSRRPTMIVTPDSGLSIYNDIVRRPVSLRDYTSGEYMHQLANLPDDLRRDAQLLTGRRYVTMIDLETTNGLNAIPEARSAKTNLVFARDLKQEDLGTSNTILLGTRAANPWVSLYWNSLDFVIERNYQDADDTIVNRRPQGSEQPEYRYTASGAGRAYYCSIAYLPLTEQHGSTLIVQGTTMHGVHTCAALLLDDARWNDLLNQVSSDAELHGFEVLMRSQAAGPVDARGQILAIHRH